MTQCNDSERPPFWTLRVSDAAVVLPDSLTLVDRATFAKLVQAFEYIERKITEHGPQAPVRGDEGLIFARSEARDCAAACRELADASSEERP